MKRSEPSESREYGAVMMNLQSLVELVAGGESETLEFKRTTGELKGGMQTTCAMLNGALPGFVLFGVGERGELSGQVVSTKTLEDVANGLRRIEPPAFPDVETIDLENGKAVIALRIPGGSDLPPLFGPRVMRVRPAPAA